MKRYFTVFSALLVIGLFSGRASAQLATPGIQFFHGTWSEALAKAQKENKLIFVDAFTTWCGPCRWMAANSFTNADVGNYFNSKFINVKLDMEQGEGRTFAQKYQVTAYPTLFFINSSGAVVKKELGAKTADQLLSAGKAAAPSTN